MREGQKVYSSDGEVLGEVKETSDDYIHVSARLAPDYWLHESSFATGDGRLETNFRADQLDAMKLKHPNAMMPKQLSDEDNKA